MKAEDYIRVSVETYLFWIRIMKEHAAFIESALPPPQSRLAAQAKEFRIGYGRLLRETISLANGILPSEMLSSGQFYTSFTETAEQDFRKFTGIQINSGITAAEYGIAPYRPGAAINPRTRRRLEQLGDRLLELTDSFIRFITAMLEKRHKCGLFFGMYPSALEHLLKEARRFELQLRDLQARGEATEEGYIAFWNQGMSEHAKSLHGQLDWSEETDLEESNSFAAAYDILIEAPQDQEKALELTTEFALYAKNITLKQIECRLMGTFTSLYTDHLTREINHYEYLLLRQGP